MSMITIAVLYSVCMYKLIPSEWVVASYWIMCPVLHSNFDLIHLCVALFETNEGIRFTARQIVQVEKHFKKFNIENEVISSSLLFDKFYGDALTNDRQYHIVQ